MAHKCPVCRHFGHHLLLKAFGLCAEHQRRQGLACLSRRLFGPQNRARHLFSGYRIFRCGIRGKPPANIFKNLPALGAHIASLHRRNFTLCPLTRRKKKIVPRSLR